jgi:hypothetical protein
MSTLRRFQQAGMRKEQPFETVTPSIAASEPHGGDNKFGNQRA